MPGPRPLAAALVGLSLVGAALAVTAQAAPSTSPAPASSPSPAASPVARQAPNVVFVLTDDLEPSLLKYMPTVRAMQKSGASFSDYVVSDSLCCPSRTSIFTGQYPHTSGVFTNSGDDGGLGAFDKNGLADQTYAVALQKAGYSTGFMGKYLNGYDPKAGDGTPGSNVPQGWDEWDVAGNGYPEFNYTMNENGREVKYGKRPQAYLTDVVSTKGQNFILNASAAGKPFALEIATFAPHAPYTPAPRDAKKYKGLKAPRSKAFNEASMTDKPAWMKDRPKLTKAQVKNLDTVYRKRAQSVRSVDLMLSRLRSTLRATGQLDNTYVVFSSDNGYHLGEHRLPAGKQTAYKTDIVVPLVVTGPGVKHATISRPAQNIDLAPTFVDLAGASALPEADGRSLLPLLKGQRPTDWRAYGLVEHHGPNLDPSDPDYAGKNGANPPSYEAITNNRLTYVEYTDGEREYYDNARDPQQLLNRWQDLSAARRAELKAALHDLQTCRGATDCSTS
ncbi:sulfatase family protein [Microlunatus antarcticus]|jgi:arylsulfatase A-like enzyme|uniref:Arylsulfatase A-like enzyme n=1 Tax=Microlunatus antarcticus TaxID=53388 RepID=A0A7W5JV99_9ACTN|nr:sulfatase [Microlunatus antarcticus]MBB3327024.1 arylsulfatase A-like enzyme [Microlunatus antarcticus]